jgi:hypothetical protein
MQKHYSFESLAPSKVVTMQYCSEISSSSQIAWAASSLIKGSAFIFKNLPPFGISNSLEIPSSAPKASGNLTLRVSQPSRTYFSSR